MAEFGRSTCYGILDVKREELIARFTAKATEAGARVQGPMSRDEAVSELVRMARNMGAHRVIIGVDLLEQRGEVVALLRARGLAVVTSASPEEAAEADIGATGAMLAIAETGSLVVAGNSPSAILPTMLPPVHVAMVETSTIVARLDEGLALVRDLALGESVETMRYVSLVTGPSRTADIEKTLSTGVHGPRELHILLVE